jgi:GNAT superfamily N-acetyltransferase
MRIERLDATDPRAFADWHATYFAALSFGLEHPSAKQAEEMRAELAGPRVGMRVQAFSGYVDERVVVTGLLELPDMDNRHVAVVTVGTEPAYRRRGHASTMLDHVTEAARSDGRTALSAEAVWPYDAPADGTGSAGADFLVRRGFTLSIADVQRALELPVDVRLLDRLAGEAAARHEGYTLRSFRGPVPDDVLEDFGELVGSLVTEAPMGELELEAEVFDAARIRSDEEVLVRAGRTKYTTLAVAPDGQLAGYSEIVVPANDPGRFYQWGTLVRRTHRGHRLGLATKVHNLRRLQDDLPAAGVLYTFNAEVNHHMIAVNEAMGFRPVQRLGEFQKKL